MKIAALFLWVLVPLGFWFAVTIWGTPHVTLTYRFFDSGDRWNPRAERVYIDCTYYGLAGTFTINAEHGTCPWIRFFKSEAS